MLKILAVRCEQRPLDEIIQTYDKTFEKSLDGDMMKLSAEFDHDIRCCMLWSSSMLWVVS